MSPRIAVAGLDPWAFSPRTRSVGINAFLARDDFQDVDARIKSGQSVLRLRKLQTTMRFSGPAPRSRRDANEGPLDRVAILLYYNVDNYHIDR